MNLKKVYRIAVFFLCVSPFVFPILHCLDGGDACGDIGDINDILRNIINVEPDMPDIPATRSFSSNLTNISLWDKTCGWRSRDSLYLVPQRNALQIKNGLDCNVFFNMSSRLPVRPDMVLSKKAIDLLVTFVKPGDQSDNFTDDDKSELGTLLKILPYLGKMSVQERRIGSTVHLGKSWNRFVLMLDTTLLLTERNFWVKNKKEREDMLALSEDLDSLGAGGATKIRFGLGDSKVKFGYKVINKKRTKVVMGIEGILPTSRIGHRQSGFELTCKSGSDRKALINDLLNVTKQIMIEPSLGTGHWGVGGFFDIRRTCIKNRLDVWAHLSYDYLLPRSQSRFMPTTDVLPLEQLTRLLKSDTIPEDFPTQKFFPYFATARVYPGNIFNAVLGTDLKFGKWKWMIGYDFYLQQKEKISRVKIPYVDPSLLRISDAESSQVLQHKVLTEIGYTKKGDRYDWNFGVGGDMSFISNGAAKDWSVYVKVGISF